MKKTFEALNESINPPAGLNKKVMERLETQKSVSFRPVAVMAAVLALVLVVTPVMAENVPLVHDALNLIAPELADRLVPVQMADEDNGITMEVVAASVHDNVAEWVIKLEGESLAEWDFVSPLISIKDHTRLLGVSTETDGESLNDYEGIEEDRENGIWYYRYQKTYPEGTTAEEILGDKITIKLSGVQVSKGGYLNGIEIPVIFTDYEQITVVYERVLFDYGFTHFGQGWGDEAYRYYMNLEEYTLMTPGESVYDATDKLSLTGAAYIDGKLHIQLAGLDQFVGDTPKWSNGRPYFQDAQGNIIRELYHNNFGIEKDGHETEYTETVYDIPMEELENYTMYVDIVDDSAIASRCSVTFKLADVVEITD